MLYLSSQGCLGKLEDWYQEQYIVILLALFVIALFKLGLLLSTIFSCVRLKRQRRNIHAYIMKSIDNKTNENIYEYKTNESKMGSLPEEPITAKYVQPNNYYSPRVRNPRIFYNRPNEMVWELATEINALERKLERFSDYLYKHQADSIMWLVLRCRFPFDWEVKLYYSTK